MHAPPRTFYHAPPPRLDVQFLDVPPSSPLTRVIKDVGVPRIIFDNFFQFMDVHFGRCVDQVSTLTTVVYL